MTQNQQRKYQGEMINRSENPITYWEGAVFTPIIPPLLFEIFSDGEAIVIDTREISYTTHREESQTRISGEKTEYVVVEIGLKCGQKFIFPFKDRKVGISFVKDIYKFRKEHFKEETRRLYK